MSLEFEKTPIWTLAQRVLSAGPTSTNYTWQAIIHTPQGDIAPMNLNGSTVERDYVRGFGDERIITVMMGRGTFAHRVLAHREHLEVTLRKLPTNESNEIDIAAGAIYAERFKANLAGDFISPSLGQGREAKDEQALNLLSIDEVHFQLQDKACEQIRVLMAGGPGRKCSVLRYLSFSILYHTKNIKVGADRALRGLEIAPISNTDVKEHVMVPHGIRLVDLADFLQKRYGVYSSGLGSYIQNGVWYIYPLYDTAQFNRRNQSLVMIVVPENKLSNVERTFYSEAGVCRILVTGKTAFRDDAGSNYQNFGNGMRFADPQRMMNVSDNASGNKLQVSRRQLNSEFVSDSAELTFAPVASNRITANPFENMSLQASKRGGYFRATWQNSDSSLITPGMAVRIVYMEEDQLKDVYGVVHGVIDLIQKPGGFTSTKYVNHTVVDVFVNDQLRPVDD